MDIKSLLRKYMSGRVKIDDFNELKRLTDQISEEALDKELEEAWLESVPKPMNSGIKSEVQEALARQLVIKQKRRLSWSSIAVAVLLPALFLSTAYLFISNRNIRSHQELTVATAKGQKTQVYLPDGTKVWLNSGSRISYNAGYNKHNRLVKLEGEAFFDVVKNQNSKFIVEAGGISVVVHGTAFNVSAYKGDSTLSVSLNRGKVHVEDNINNTLIANLLPDQQVIVNKKDLGSRLMPCDSELQSLWTQNKLKLEDVSTQELFDKMEHWYGVNIHIEDIDSANRYALTLKTESLREMLDLINKLTPITYTINGEEVTIRYLKRK